MQLRRAVHAAGLRYRVDAALPVATRRRADMLFTRARVAVFVDGCFWHQCPLHGSMPTHNREWWTTKLAANVARDRDTDVRLSEAGWQSVRVWEHEEPLVAAARVISVVRARLAKTTTPSDHAKRSR